MPIKVPSNLPAVEILRGENIFVMDENRAISQDIRPLEILILNLMPLKEITETQLLRLLGNGPLQTNITFLQLESHESKNVPIEHLFAFYNTFNDVKDKKYDGLVITGAPIEKLEFNEVDYWDELTKIMEWSNKNVTSTFHICWGAQAGLYYHYGIGKYPLENKMFGIFKHKKNVQNTSLLRGFDDYFYAPHSRYTEIRKKDIQKVDKLEIFSESDEAGIYIVVSKDRKKVFVTGHSEYDPLTLKEEYERDIAKGLDISIPINYFLNDDSEKEPVVKWRSHANLLFSNWLNYYVYQATPFNIDEIK